MFSPGKDNSISIDIIEQKVNNSLLAQHYLGIMSLPIVINSILRDDKNPSLYLYTIDGSKIFYKDFATGDKGDIYKLLSLFWGINKFDTLKKILNDFKSFSDYNNLILTKKDKINKEKIQKNILSNIKLECVVREWKEHDIEYWGQYGIDKKWLIFANIYPIKYIIITKNNNKYVIKSEKYAYAYAEFKDNLTSLKIYQPFSKKYKWTNNHNSSVWDLWRQLPKTGENLIITSSRKDALCLWANTGIPSCSLQAESTIPKDHVIQQLKDRFKNIFILYDNDFKSNENHGRILGEKLSEKFNLKQIEILDDFKAKDPSDLFLSINDKNLFKKTIINLIN